MSTPVNELNDSDAEDQLDAVLKEAARLAAQMRSVSGQEDDMAIDDDAIEDEDQPEEHNNNNNQVLLPPYTFARSDLSLGTHEVPGLPPAIDVPESHDDNTSMAGSAVTFDTFLNRGGTPSNASVMRKKEAGDTPSSAFNDTPILQQNNDVDAAIRASEEMAKVMAALGVPSSQKQNDDDESIDTSTSLSQSLHSNQDAISRNLNKSNVDPHKAVDDDDFSVPMKDYSSRHSGASNMSAHHPKQKIQQVNSVDDYTPKKANNSVVPGLESRKQVSSNLHSIAPSFAEAGAHTSPWKSYSAGIPLHQSKTHETDEPSELTEPIFQSTSDAPSWTRNSNDAKDLEKRVESSLWQKVEDAQDGDDDFVPLRDYSHQSVTVRDYTAPTDSRASDKSKSAQGKQSQKSSTNSAGGVQWDTLQEPSTNDDDFVTIRGLSSKRDNHGSKSGSSLPYRNLEDTGVRSTDHQRNDPPPVIRESSKPASIDNVPSFEEGADLLAMNDFQIKSVANRKLRTPHDVRWEKMDYATEIDDDFVPLKDYSKMSPVSPATSGSSTGTTTRGFTPFFASSSKSEYENIMSVYRSQDHDQEGPTAFELKRRKERRKKKMRRIKIAISALLFVGAVIYVYQKAFGLSSIKSDSVATASYRNRRSTKAKAHRQRDNHKIEQPSQRASIDSSANQDQEIPPSWSPRQQSVPQKDRIEEQKDAKSTLHDTLERSKNKEPHSMVLDLEEPTVQQGVKVFVENPPTPNEPIHAAPTRVTVTDLNATRASSNGNPMEKRIVQPGAGICLLPMAYLLVDKCHFADPEERKEELLQAMLD